jgi:hypothetical protein
MPAARPEVARGALRGVRAAVLAASALALASTAHVAAGGGLPSLPLLALLAVPVVWGAVALTVRPLGPVALTLGLGGAQVLLHEALMALSTGACGAPQAGTAAMAGMAGMHGGVAAPTGCVAHAMPAVGTSAAATGTAMLLAHAVATVLTALVLARGERVVVCLLTLLAWSVRRLNAGTAVPPVVDVRSSRLRHTWPDAVELASAVLDAAGGRRGPPRALAAAPAR